MISVGPRHGLDMIRENQYEWLFNGAVTCFFALYGTYYRFSSNLFIQLVSHNVVRVRKITQLVYCVGG